MLDAYIEGAASEALESALKYTIPNTSSAVVSRREATIHASGGAQYSSVNGVRACVFKIYQENQFLDTPSLFFRATYVNDSGAILSFKAPAFAAFSRVTVRLGSTLAEDCGPGFGRFYSLLHTLSDPEDQNMMSITAGDGPDGALGATGTTLGSGASGKFGFSLSPLAFTRMGKLWPCGLAGVEITMELVPQALDFAKTADQSTHEAAWSLQDCQLCCTMLTLDSAINEQIHKATLSGRSIPCVLPGVWFLVDQTSTSNGTFHLAKNCSRAEKLLCTYTGPGDDECIDFAKPGGTGTFELMVASKRYPDRPIELDDPIVFELLQRTVGKGQKMNISRHSYWTQTTGRENFVIGIPLTKSPGDGIDGQVAFTGENLRTGSLVSVQQKGLTGVDRIFLALSYTALVEVEAAGVSISE